MSYNKLSWDRIIFADTLRPHLAGKHVLDLGCGSGLLTEYIASLSASVTGIDFSRSLIKGAEDLKSKSQYGDQLNFIYGAFLNGAHIGKSFDIILGHDILHGIGICVYPHLVAFLKALLKDGGFCIFQENSYFSIIYRFAREKLVGRYDLRKLGSVNETPFDKKRFIVLSENFEYTNRACWAFTLFSRAYYQFLNHLIKPRLPVLSRIAGRASISLDKLVMRKIGDNAATRYFSYLQVIYLSDSMSYSARFGHNAVLQPPSRR